MTQTTYDTEVIMANIRAIGYRKGFSDAELKLRITQAALNLKGKGYERSYRQQTTFEELMAMADAMNMSVTEICGGPVQDPNELATNPPDWIALKLIREGLAGLWALAWKGKQPHRFYIEKQLTPEHYLVQQVGSEWEKTVVGQVVPLHQMQDWQIGTKEQLSTILNYHTRNKVILYPIVKFSSLPK